MPDKVGLKLVTHISLLIENIYLSMVPQSMCFVSSCIFFSKKRDLVKRSRAGRNVFFIRTTENLYKLHSYPI